MLYVWNFPFIFNWIETKWNEKSFPEKVGSENAKMGAREGSGNEKKYFTLAIETPESRTVGLRKNSFNSILINVNGQGEASRPKTKFQEFS